ncbi:MAG: urate oxidase [Chloroflexota bacterium]|nr:urate oxidase [Chloroflexota bacterium]
MSDFDYQIGYGKLRVPVYRVYARPLLGVTPIPESSFTGRDNTLFAVEIDVEVLGDNFLPAYTAGDNSMVVATDSMKNYILRESLTYDGSTLEGLLAYLGAGFINRYEQINALQISGRELPFQPAQVPAGERFGPSPVLFNHGRGDYATAALELQGNDGEIELTDHLCGRVELQLLKVTGSAFTSFVRDGYTTLPDRRDRPLYIFLDVHWRYADADDPRDPSPARYVPAEQIRDLVTAVFHELVSESIQHLVHEMGARILDRFPQLAEVSFAAQNRTRDPVAESATDPRVKVYSDPFPAYGEITLTMRRTEAPEVPA